MYKECSIVILKVVYQAKYKDYFKLLYMFSANQRISNAMGWLVEKMTLCTFNRKGTMYIKEELIKGS